MRGVLFISCIRFSLQLFISEAPFVTQWKHKRPFVGRLIGSIVLYFIAAYAVFELAVNIPFVSPVIVILYYLALFFLSLVSMKLIFEVTWGDILFAGVCGYAAQHFSYACITLVTQLVPLSLNGIWEFLFIRLFPYICVSFIMYFGFVRRNAGKIEIKKRDIRMVWLAFGVLFTAIIISVLVDPDFYRDNAVLMQNIFCKIYAGICSIFAIFIAFYMSRQNRIQHENEIMESMLHNIAEQQKLSQETINLINIKCHDLKYRISKISSITDEKDQLEYINSVKNTVAIYDNIF